MIVLRLTDPWFDAKFYGKIDEADQSHEYLPSIDGAQGLFLWCPCGYGQLDDDGKERYPLDLSHNLGRPHGLLVPFRNPRNAPPCPDGHGPRSRDKQTRPRWEMTGTSLGDLTLSPSIAVGPADKECWHGHVTSGEIR